MRRSAKGVRHGNEGLLQGESRAVRAYRGDDEHEES